MSKPRIVREMADHSAWARWLCEGNDGPAYLALPWPEACPYTPEQVMAACGRDGWRVLGVPEFYCELWHVPVMGMSRATCTLTPEFMAEPKRCEHSVRRSDWGKGYATCAECGAILSDRRKGERRKCSRRPSCIDAWGRRQSLHDRRSFKDRRRQP